MAPTTIQYYVSGDIGGTYTRFALLKADSGGFHMLSSVRLKTREVTALESTLESHLQAFRKETEGQEISGVCMSAAGPVENNVCHLTNAALTIDGNALESHLGVPTLVINDFTAVCYGVPLLTSDNSGQLIRLSHATPDGADETKTAAVVGAGTGLGVGYLHWNDRATRAFPSEAGHADFAPFDEESEQLWSFVRRRTGAAPDAEKFVSGQGLANIADYAHEAFPDSAALSRIADAPQGEKPSMLAEAAATDDACASAMRLFVKMYGRYSGNVALHFLPRYGLYLAGGIVSKNLNWFSDAETFMDAFRSNQVESIESILAKIPVYAITEPAVSYIGAARAVATERAAAAATESL